jgi:glycosyltransferase involved in cell wall biosynthesis
MVAYARFTVPEDVCRFAKRMNTHWQIRINALSARIRDNDGLAAKRETRSFIRWAETFDPDIVWLHNLHGYYINIEILFAWIKTRPKMQVFWTLHDCWAFTGHCAYFTAANCEKWKHHCGNCSQKRDYPASYLAENSSRNFDRKRTAFQGIPNMTIITPSQWLADLVKQSFLGEYSIEVRHNHINTNIFRPTPSDFRERYGLQEKIIILGVAGVWSRRKGLEDLVRLASMLDERYAMVLVGLTQKQIRRFPMKILGLTRSETLQECAVVYRSMNGMMYASTEEKNALCTPKTVSGDFPADDSQSITHGEVASKPRGVAIPADVNALYREITGKSTESTANKTPISNIILFQKTNSAKELAEFYTAADYYVNPTYEDNYPTTNLEALACGTSVITYDIGGCAETLLQSCSDLMNVIDKEKE